MNSPFVVYPAKVVGGVQNPIYYPNPAVKPHYGIPLALFNMTNDSLRLEIIPWDNQTVNDSAWLIINKGTPMFIKSIQTGEENKSFDHNVPKAFFNDGINTLVVRVTNTVEPEGTDSIELLTLVHIPRPGGEVPGSGDNSNLILSLSHTSVGPIEAANGVDATLTYTYMREGDDINLDLDGRAYPHKVTAAEAKRGQVVIKLLAKDFWQDNAQFAIRYRVTDSLSNSSGPLSIWSKTTTVDVHVKQPDLDLLPPKVLEATGSNGTVLDFDKNFYQAQHATVDVKYTGSAPGQTVKVYWTGRATTYGSEIKTVTYAGQTLRFLIPRHEVIDCLGSKAEVTYTVKIPNDPKTYLSRDLDLTVTAQKHHLPEPTLNASRTNLRIYYPTLEAQYTGRISLLVGTTRYDSSEFPVTQSSYTDVAVPQSWYSGNQGKPGLFNFTIRRTGSLDNIIFSWFLRLTL
ncbi:hypothetical protein ACKJSM_20585 [Pseudomonas sp. PHC1]|uniref:hypothetical protein n=1 Tax=Pseudomonas sp. PHC1 TaxID=3384759 RepID=UPI00396F655E